MGPSAPPAPPRSKTLRGAEDGPSAASKPSSLPRSSLRRGRCASARDKQSSSHERRASSSRAARGFDSKARASTRIAMAS
eukprot:4807091-Alexandrium_andersonii.AAC.1